MSPEAGLAELDKMLLESCDASVDERFIAEAKEWITGVFFI